MTDHISHRLTTDEWDAHVRAFALTATGGNDEHAARWPEAEWRAAAIAAASLRPALDSAGSFVMDPNEVVPDWLREELAGRVTPRGDAPAPTICTLWVEHRDWFALADLHPRELVVTATSRNGGPGLVRDQFHAAWDLAVFARAIPLVTIALRPKIVENAVRCVGELQAFSIVSPDGVSSVEEHVSRILNLSPCTRSWTTPVSDAELLDAARTLRGDPGLEARVTVWDWMSGGSDRLDPAGPFPARPA